MIPFRTLRNLIITMQKLYSYTCLCEPIQNKLLWLNKLVRLNKAVLYNEEFVNAGIVDYGHLINSAGEILDYDGVTEKFHIPRVITLPSLNLFKYVQQYLSARKTTKIINYLIIMTIYLLFDRLLTIIHFLQNGFIFLCVSLILWSQSNNKNFGVKI